MTLDEARKDFWAKKSKEEKDRIAQKRISTMGEEGIRQKTIKATQTKLERGLIATVNLDGDTPYKIYKRAVQRITKSQDLSIISNYDKRGKHDYHLDHIFPISKGFLYDIPPELIGDIKNLTMIPAQDNKRKSATIVLIPEHIEQYIKENLNSLYMELLNENLED